MKLDTKLCRISPFNVNFKRVKKNIGELIKSLRYVLFMLIWGELWCRMHLKLISKETSVLFWKCHSNESLDVYKISNLSS